MTGKRIRLSPRGLQYHRNNRGRGVEWDGRMGVLVRITSKLEARVVWDGNQSVSDAIPLNFVEVV